MVRPIAAEVALVDRRRGVEHARADVIVRAARSVIDDGVPIAVAARARGVPESRVRAEVLRMKNQRVT